MTSYFDTHRRPGEETIGLYPGLVVSDGEHSRVSGSITVGRTRLPLWAFVPDLIWEGWKKATKEFFEPVDYKRFPRSAAIDFFVNLTDARGEFGRLVLMLGRGRYETNKRERKKMIAQMKWCIEKLEAGQ